MSANTSKIGSELEALGFATNFSSSPYGAVISFPYTIEVGPRVGESVTVGLSMQGSEMYPEYPPHWLHISPPFDDARGGVVNNYKDGNGRSWMALSRPPGPSWDRLPTKHISHYLTEHLRSFWYTV